MESSETSPAETPSPPEQATEAKKQSETSGARPEPKESKRRSGRQRSGRKKGRSNNNRPKNQIDDSPFGRIQSSYFACARCSFFWSTLRVMLTLTGLEKIVAEQKEGWMTTPWSHSLREHVERCYGVEIFSGTTHYQGTCLECGRNFVVSGEEESAEMTTFEIQAERLAPYPR